MHNHRNEKSKKKLPENDQKSCSSSARKMPEIHKKSDHRNSRKVAK